MGTIRVYASRNYITLMICAVALIALVGSGLSSASGSKDLSSSRLVDDGRTLTTSPTTNDIGGQVTNATLGGGRVHSTDPRSLLIRRASLASPFVPNITATLADTLQVDNNNIGKADPGDTLMYTVTITNTGTDATGVVFTDDLSQNGGNLTLVAGSVMSTPVARADSYPNGIGNTRMTVTAAAGVLVNDFDPDGTSPTVVAIVNGVTTLGGVVNLATDGSFVYDPPVGVTSTTDTFTYTATDGTKTDTAIVSITLTERVWYVNSAAAVDGDGRSNTPFKVITGHLDGAGGAGDVDSANDYIFLFAGSYSVATLPLEAGQRLIGQGVNLVVNSQTLVTATSKPTLTGSATAVTLSTGNTVSGLDVSGTSGITGSSIGALTVSVVGATGTNGPAVDLQTTGALSVQFDSLSSSGGGIGMRLTGAASGTFAVSGTTTVNKTSGSGDGVTITGGAASVTFTGAVSVTTLSGKGIVANAAGGITIASSSSMVDATGGAALDLQSQNLGSGWNFSLLKSTNSAAEGIKMAGCIQNLTATTTNIQTPTGTGIDIQNTFGTSTLSFGSTTVNKTAAGTGVNLVSNGTSTVSFGSLNITAGNGSGLVASTSGTVNATSGTISATGGPGLNLLSVTMGLTLTSVSSTNSGSTGITLAGVGGSLSIGTTTITNPSGIGISETNSNASVNCGNATVNGSASTGVFLGASGLGNTGTITFGALNIAPDGAARGLFATDNTMTITATSGAISTSGAIAVEITRASPNTTPLMMSLTSVSANGGSKGISLNGTSGSFTINGTATTDGTGGTIQNITARGVEFSNATNITLKNMSFINANTSDSALGLIDMVAPGNNASSANGAIYMNSVNTVTLNNVDVSGTIAQMGIVGVDVNNLTLTGSTVTNAGDGTFIGGGFGLFECGLRVLNLSGTCSITSTIISFSETNNVDIFNLDKNLNLTLDGSTFRDTQTVSMGGATNTNGEGGILFRSASTAAGAPTSNIVIKNNSQFFRNRTQAIQVFSGDDTTINLDITGSVIDAQNDIGTGIDINADDTSTLNFNITGNPTIQSRGGAAVNITSFLNGHIEGRVSNNSDIEVLGGAGIPVRVVPQETSSAIVLIHNNTVSNINGTEDTVIDVQARFQTATANVTITNNTVTGEPTGIAGINLIGGSSTAGETNVVCANVANNNVTNAVGNTLRAFRVRVSDLDATSDPRVNLEGFVEAGTSLQDVEATWNGKGNTPTSSAGSEVAASLTGTATAPGSCAAQVPDTPLPASMRQLESVVSKQSGTVEGEAASQDATELEVFPGERSDSNQVQTLSPQELVWIVQAAIARWREMGISPEDMARLEAATFEIADLQLGRIAAGNATHFKIDDTAAGFGWYCDEFPHEDGEFQVIVHDKELQTTELSLAHGKMDLLTVVMRQLGTIYMQGKEKLPRSIRRNLKPLMEGTLSPSVRRLPLDQWRVTPPSTGSTKLTTSDRLMAQANPTPQQNAAQPRSQSVSAQVEAPAAKPSASTAKIPAAARYAVYHRPAATRPRDVAVMGIHDDSLEPSDLGAVRRVAMTRAASRRMLTPTMSPPLGGIVSVGPFNLPAGETVTIMFNATIDTPVVPAGTTQVCTRGTVTADGGISVQTTDPGPPIVNGATCTPLAQANLAVTKSDTPDPVITGNNITYTVNLINNGPDSAYNVKVSDAIPANTTFVSALPPAGWARTDSVAVGGTGTIVFEKSPAGPVLNAGTAQFQIVVQVSAATPGGTIITNNAVATADTPDGTQANNTGTTTTTAQSQADLAVTKSDSPDPVIAGNNITYTINFSNNGPGSATNVTVTDAVPANTTFVSATVTTGTGWSTMAPAVGGTGNVVFSKTPVPNGETAVFTIVVKVNSSTANGATITNSVSAAPTSSDPDTNNNTATAMTTVNTQADLAVTKSDSPDPVNAGANLTYTINFTNSGPSDAQTVTVTDAVPANTTFVSATVTTGTGWGTSAPAVGGTGNVVFSKATVTAGETAVFTIVVNVGASTANGATISNTATAATTTTDPTSTNDSGNANTTVQTRADLAVTKSDSPDPVIAGNNLTYTVNFMNSGPSDAQMVTVTDGVPTGTTFVSAMVTTGAGWSIMAPAVGGTGNVVFSKATVAAGESAVFQIVVAVDGATANGATISNSAIAASATTDPTPGNNTGTAMTTVQTSADLAVTKTDSPDPVFAGNNITYTINFSNSGPSFATGVMVTDAVPANTTFVSASVTTGTGWSVMSPAVGGTGNVVFSKASVTNVETAVFQIVVKVNSNTTAGTLINNSALAASSTTDANSGNNTANADTTVQVQADVAITKTDSPDPVIAGTNLTYTINLSNNGPSDASTVSVTDAVPTGTTFVSATVTTGTGWSVMSPAVGGTGNVVFSKATVVNGETAVFTIVVNVNANVANGTNINNTATVTATSADGTTGNNTATAMTAVQTQADLTVTKSDSPDPAIAGNNLTYTVNFSNNGPSDAQTVTVTDSVPADATFVSASVTTGTGWTTTPPPVGGPGDVVFSKGTVAAGETAVFQIVVNIDSDTANGATITNNAVAASTTTDPTPANNTGTATTSVITRVDLSVTKTDAPDPVIAGNNITYTVNFSNAGPSDAQMVTVTDAVPTNTTFVSASVTTGSGWSTSAPAVGGTGNVVFSKTTVAAGETAVFTIVVKVNSNTADGAVISNMATAASATTDTNSGNNTGTATTSVLTQADIAVTKTDSPDPVIATQNLTYTLNFVNSGPSDAQNITITDGVPANTTFVSAAVTTGTGWSLSSPAVGGTGNVVFSKATVPGGETAVFQIVVNVNANTPHNTTIMNSATAVSSTADPNTGNNIGTASTTVIAQADLAVMKSGSPNPVCVNGNETYTIEFVNNGPGPGINTTVTDAVPANTTFVSAAVIDGKGWSIMNPPVGGTGNVVFSKASTDILETATFQIVVKVNIGTLHGTTISNTVVAASSIPDPTPGNNSAMASATVDPTPPTIVCPANVTQATDPNQCSAVVTYAAPTVSDNCPGVGAPVCSPPSGATFAKGTTTVTCNVSDTAGNQSSCSFTVTVNDTQPPAIACPADITVKAPAPGAPCAVGNYTTPVPTDNCPGVTVACVPPSGTCFPLGTTTVTCTATDASGNTAACSFKVTVFDLCVQSDSNPNTAVLINSATGDYRFCCNGVTYTGKGTIIRMGNIYTLQHNPSDRRVLVKVDETAHKATGSIQSPPGVIKCTIVESNTQNSTCACQ